MPGLSIFRCYSALCQTGKIFLTYEVCAFGQQFAVQTRRVLVFDITRVDLDSEVVGLSGENRHIGR